MKLFKFSFPNSAFSALSEAERVFFLRLAHIHNDLRHITHLLRRESNGLAARPAEEAVQQILLHQNGFATRLWNGTLVEAWKVIAGSWFNLQVDPSNPKGPKIPGGSGLTTTLAADLDDNGRKAAQDTLQFFTGRNVPYIIRNKFAFHHDEQRIQDALPALNGSTEPSFVTGERSANIFYQFAEAVRHDALIAAGEGSDFSSSSEKLYDQLGRAHILITSFCEVVLCALATKCDLTSTHFESNAVTDLTTVQPIFFSDEEAIKEHLKQKGLI
jgi:hypothetical protein